MQETRQRILEILKVGGQATVDELSEQLGLTAVTIRHHLEVLRSEGLVSPPRIRRKGGPGRPQHVYELAAEADSYFPKNYDRLAEAMLIELESRIPPQQMEELVESIAERLAVQTGLPMGGTLASRLGAVVEHLNDIGYLASLKKVNGQYQLGIANCPYEKVASRYRQPCEIDRRMIGRLVGAELQRLEMADGEDRCTYLFSDGRTS